MTRTIVTIIIGTLLLFIWNAISWMALPFHSQSLNTIPDGALQNETLQQSMPESGVYHYPGLPEDNSPETIAKIENQLSKGPRITLMVYKNEPTKLFDPSTFVYSLFINLLTTVIAFLLVSRIQTKSFMSILGASILIGLVSVLVSDVAQMNWFMFTLDYTIANAIDKLVAFALLGLLFGMYTFKSKAGQ